jgi:hypothetical protein
MPMYVFEHPVTKSIQNVFFHMNDEKKFVDEQGVEWNRVYISPNAAIDTQVDPYSAKDFAKATNKPGTLGDLFDRSQELHLKRKDKEGKDPFREKFYENYSKKHKGNKHYLQQREENAQKFKDIGISVEMPDN